MQPSTYFGNAIVLSALIEDEAEYEVQREYLWSLLGHTETYREQASWCWLLKYAPKLSH